MCGRERPEEERLAAEPGKSYGILKKELLISNRADEESEIVMLPRLIRSGVDLVHKVHKHVDFLVCDRSEYEPTE
jgi:hypothetical protein